MGLAESRQEQFWEACGFGHVERVRIFIAEGVDVNWVSKSDGSLPIHVASHGKPGILELLIEAGCDVNSRDEREATAIHHAASNNFANCVQLLIDAGGLVNSQDKNGWSPLHCAAYWGYPDVISKLLAAGADVNCLNKDKRLPIHEVARSKSQDEEAVGQASSLLINAGSNLLSRTGNELYGDFTVLMLACYHGHISIVQQLLDSDCNINDQSSNKWTALHWAADRSHDDIVGLLLEYGADSTIKGERLETAEDRARTDVVRAIFKKYTDIEKNDDDRCAIESSIHIKDADNVSTGLEFQTSVSTSSEVDETSDIDDSDG